MSFSLTEAGPPAESMAVHEEIAVERYGLYTQGLGKVLEEAFPVAHVKYYFSLHQFNLVNNVRFFPYDHHPQSGVFQSHG